jgi:hypothetical protein
MLQWLYNYVSSVCSRCFICFRHMLQVFHLCVCKYFKCFHLNVAMFVMATHLFLSFYDVLQVLVLQTHFASVFNCFGRML